MTLHATLRLQHHLENSQTFPLHEDLLPHLRAERMQHKLTLHALDAEQATSLGWRSYVDTSKQPKSPMQGHTEFNVLDRDDEG